MIGDETSGCEATQSGTRPVYGHYPLLPYQRQNPPDRWGASFSRTGRGLLVDDPVSSYLLELDCKEWFMDKRSNTLILHSRDLRYTAAGTVSIGC